MSLEGSFEIRVRVTALRATAETSRNTDWGNEVMKTLQTNPKCIFKTESSCLKKDCVSLRRPDPAKAV